jgi:hypothetical protein
MVVERQTKIILWSSAIIGVGIIAYFMLKGKIGKGKGDVVGKCAYFLKEEGFVNVRTEPKIDDNLLYKHNEDKAVGEILKSVLGEDNYYWHEVETNKGKGYVREDVVNIKKC